MKEDLVLWEERKEVVTQEGDTDVQDFTGGVPGSMWVAEVKRRPLKMGRERSQEVRSMWIFKVPSMMARIGIQKKIMSQVPSPQKMWDDLRVNV